MAHHGGRVAAVGAQDRRCRAPHRSHCRARPPDRALFDDWLAARDDLHDAEEREAACKRQLTDVLGDARRATSTGARCSPTGRTRDRASTRTGCGPTPTSPPSSPRRPSCGCCAPPPGRASDERRAPVHLARGLRSEGADIQDQLFDVDVQLRRQASACPSGLPRQGLSPVVTDACVSSRAARRVFSTGRSTTPRRSPCAVLPPCR